MFIHCAVLYSATGFPTLLTVTVQGDTEGITVERIAFLDTNGNTILMFELPSVIPIGNTYNVFNFPLPPSTFQLQITGVDALGNQVSRISTAGTQPSTVDIRLGKICIDY